MMRQLLKCSIIVAVVGMFFLPTFAQEAFNRHEKLKEGDWVKYITETTPVKYKSKSTPKMTYETEMRVTRIEGKKITSEIHGKILMDGKLLGEPTKTTKILDISPTKELSKKVEDAALKVNGKELKCKVYTLESASDYVIKTWMCEDVPFGVVKVETNGKVTMELVDWGSKE